jgi:hypothetical protein
VNANKAAKWAKIIKHKLISGVQWQQTLKQEGFKQDPSESKAPLQKNKMNMFTLRSQHNKDNFSGTFAKLRKTTTSSVVSVRTEQLGSQWTNFHSVLYLNSFLTSAKTSSTFIKI